MHRPSRVLLFLPLVAAVAGGPFGGDDSGYVPPNRSVAKCEQQVARSLASFDRCALTCNVRAAKAAFKGRPIDLPACTQTGARSCRGRYDRASARMAQTGRCPACLSPAAQGLLADGAAARFEQAAAAIHCRAAPDAAALRCEDAVARNLARTIVCSANCHVAAASAGLKDRPFDEEGCERSCRRSYDEASARLAPHCPPCLGAAEQADLADQAEAAADEENGDIFCAGGSATTTTTSTTPAPSTTSTMPASSTTTTMPSTTTTSTTVAASTTSIAPTTSTTSTTLACAGEGAPCGAALDGCTARMVCVDGALVCRGTFVAPPPLGDPANPGTQAAPLSTLGAGIENAAGLGVHAVCACAGEYVEDLTVAEGISLRGGYDCNTWTRDPTTHVTGVTGPSSDGLKIPSGVTAATSLDGLTIRGAGGLFSDVSSALTVTDASPILKDLTVTDGVYMRAQTSYGLHIRQTGGSPASPTIVNGTYRAQPSPGGTGIAIFIEGASPTLTNVVAYGAPTDAYPNGATAVGIRCTDCSGTTISHGGIVGGSATSMSAGIWASGDVTGLSAGDMTFFWGGYVSGPGTSYGTLLDGCIGASTWSVASLGFFHDSVASNSIGFSASGASCRPTVTASLLVGCELTGYCAALQCTGAPCTVTDSTLDATFDASAHAVNSYGARCLEGGCAFLARNTISAGNVYESHLEPAEGIGVDVEGASPTLDANVIDGPSCPSGLFGSSTLAALQLRGSLSLVTNNLLRGGPCPAASEVVGLVKKSNGADVLAPTLENNTLEYGPCPGCGAHTGLFVSSAGAAAPAGSVRNNIIHATTSGGPSFAVFEADASSDLAALENNDLDDPTGVLYYDEGTTALTLSDINALPGAAGNISADPLLDTTGHLAAASPCRNAGTATGAPATDRDGDSRPQEGAVDIGADEFVP